MIIDNNETINLNINKDLNIDILKNLKPSINIITTKDTSFNLNINIEENSSLKLFIALFGKNNFNDININLNGKNSNINLTLINLSNNGISNINTTINHLNDFTNSIVTNDSLLTNKSKVLLNVINNINDGTINSNANQSIEGLLLDKDSKLEMIPTLFIDNNKVFANHSAKISRINDNDLYYIMTKGISKEDASKMYANNFLLKHVSFELKEKIKKLIERSI